MSTAYTFYEDGAHGWLRVPLAELQALGIADKVTAYSYQDADYAYLEEDLDLKTFIVAKGVQWKDLDITKQYDAWSPIRNKASYTSQNQG